MNTKGEVRQDHSGKHLAKAHSGRLLAITSTGSVRRVLISDMRHLFSAVTVVLALIASGPAASEEGQTFATRFGPLVFKNSVLTFKGRPLSPQVDDPFGVPVTPEKFSVREADVFLFHQPMGTGCPGNFVFVTVLPAGVRVSRHFGTCYDDNTEPVLSGDTISFSMPNKGGKGKSTFTWKDGVVYQNGKPL